MEALLNSPETLAFCDDFSYHEAHQEKQPEGVMQLSTAFNPVTAYDSGMATRHADRNKGAQNTGERIVYSSPWLLTQNTQSRKEYLEALERPDNTWDVVKHELYYAHGRWREDSIDLLATGLSADELAEFIKEYEDEQETKARDAASSQTFKPDLYELIFKKLETPDSEDKRKKDREPEPETIMEPSMKPSMNFQGLETLHPSVNKRPGMAA